MKKAALLFLSLFFMCIVVMSQKATLKVGDIAPAFSVADQHGTSIDLHEQLQQSKVVLVFYRGHWCPYCNRELIALQDSLKLLNGKKARVIAVSPELPAFVQKTIEKTAISFPILSDKGHIIMDKYGVTMNLDMTAQNRLKTIGVDLSIVNGANGNVLPVPAVYIINQQGKIDHIFFDPNYRIRPSVHDILSHL